MLKACGRCGKLHPLGYVCRYGQKLKYSERSDIETAKLHNKSAWRNKRASIRERAFNLCEVCKAQGIYNYSDIEIHHITKLSKDPTGLLEDSNLIALCVKHHKQADRGELEPTYLRELAQARDTEPDSVTIGDTPPL